VAQRVWPTREEWAAKAEQYVRTTCYTSQRVSRFPLDWLTSDQLIEARRLVAEIVKVTRREINRVVRTTEDGDEQQVALNCRTQLNAANKTATALYKEADSLGQAWARICTSADVMGVASEQADQLAAIGTEMLQKRDDAAKAELDAAIEREKVKRASDEGWQQELERRASIEAGPTITRHAA
jgi:hypothetical protein